MSIVPTSSKVPVVPVVAGAVVAQFADAAIGLLSPAGFLPACSRSCSPRARPGWPPAAGSAPVVARTGLAVGATSAVLGLLVGGLGLVAIILAGITVVAGVAGAVVGRPRP